MSKNVKLFEAIRSPLKILLFLLTCTCTLKIATRLTAKFKYCMTCYGIDHWERTWTNEHSLLPNPAFLLDDCRFILKGSEVTRPTSSSSVSLLVRG